VLPRGRLRGQPVERRPGRHYRGRVDAVLARQDLLHAPPQPVNGPRGPVRLLAHGLRDRLQHPLVGPGSRPGREPVIDQPPGTALLIRQPQPLQRAQRHRPAKAGKLADLGQLPLAQGASLRIVLRPGPGSRRGARRDTGNHLDDVPLPPQCLIRGLRRQGIHQTLGRQGRRRPCHHPEPRRAQQFRQRHAGLRPGHVREAGTGAGQAGHRVHRTADLDLVADPQQRRP